MVDEKYIFFICFALTLIMLISFSEPTEYVDFLFDLDSKFGIPNLTKFEELSNKEMMWVITEIVTEHNIKNRAKVIKDFIKVRKLNVPDT